MNHIANFKWTGTRYWCTDATPLEMHIIGSFFATDVSMRQDTIFLDWVKRSHRLQTNTALLDRLPNGIIEMRDVLDDGDFDDPVIRIPVETYLKMVQDWQELVKKRPPFIVITRDGDTFSVEACDK